VARSCGFPGHALDVERPERTFVVSDSHGHPEVIAAALEHGCFLPGVDALVFAGDLVDRGPDPEGCLALLDSCGAEILVGNHDAAVILGFPLFEQSSESRRLRQVFLDRVLSADPAAAWKAVTVVDGIPVSHAGISADYTGLLRRRYRGSVRELAAHLNEDFLAAVRRELESGEWDDEGVLGDRGPLWFRPPPYSSLRPLPGLTQVVGHTPPLPEWQVRGFHMVDPCVYLNRGRELRFRYAVIQGGRVRVEEGVTGVSVPAEAALAPRAYPSADPMDQRRTITVPEDPPPKAATTSQPAAASVSR
jgi:hypothetical protein